MKERNKADIVSLFDSLFEGIIDSFTPVIDQVFSDFESKVSSNKYSRDELNGILESILTKFPRSHADYQEVIDTITSFAAANPTFIVISLCSRFKTELTRGNDTLSSTLHYNPLSYKNTNFHHFQFIRYLSLIIISDIILSIFKKYPSKQPINKLVPCGYNICTCDSEFEILHKDLIRTWSLIFCDVSKISLSEIAIAFEQYNDETNAGNIYQLIGLVNGNQAFYDSLFFSLQQAKKHKDISNGMFSSLSIVLSHAKCDEDVLNEFFNIAWANKSTSSMKDGAINLITVLFNRLPQHQKKVNSFYQSRVYKNAVIPSKTARSAQAFLRLIQGDISGIEIDGDLLDNFNYIGCCGSNGSENESYSSIFMKNFYPKSDFSICTILFRDILIHLASLDFHYFTKFIVPSFLKLQSKDPRFITFLLAMPFLDSGSFKDRAISKPSDNDLTNLKESVRKIILDLIPVLEDSLKGAIFTLPQSVHPLQSLLDEADHNVSEFLTLNNYYKFEPSALPSIVNKVSKTENQLALCILSCFPICLHSSDLSSGPLLHLIIKFSVHDDSILSAQAYNIAKTLISLYKIDYQFIKACIKIIIDSKSTELHTRCLENINNLVQKKKGAYDHEIYSEIESVCLLEFCSDLPYCRFYALRLIKHLSAIGKSNIYDTIHSNTGTISEAVNRAILVINVPEKPSMITPPIGTLDYEYACKSRYNDLWLIFLSEIFNVLIDNGLSDVFNRLNKQVLNKIKSTINEIGSQISNFSMSAIYLLYCDSIAFQIPITTEEEIEQVEYDETEVNEVQKLFTDIIKSDSPKAKQVLMKAFCFFNWRIIPGLLPIILTCKDELFGDIAEALSFIIQSPYNFNHIISSIFLNFVEFLSLLQSYFMKLKINSAREIKWDKEHLNLLNQHQTLCINYCILISAAFNNIQDQIPEESWPVSYRQILVQFLIHWAQLPEGHEKIKSYAINALIPIIHAGTVFTDGFAFDLSILEMMVQCQLNGYPVLDSLLLFHIDILLDEFVKNVFLRNRRESILFSEAILSALEFCNQENVLVNHVGSLVLLSMFFIPEHIDQAKSILTKIAKIFLQKDEESDQYQAIVDAETFDFVPTVFQFCLEQLIESAFEIIRSSDKVTVLSDIVNILTPWYEKIRLLPTHSYICQGIPSKYRKFTVITFLESMLSVTNSLSEEQHDIFAQLWFELLRSGDNSVIVLICLFESEESVTKEKIFSQLLENDPAIVSKYLTKRCSFAYWYFMSTQRQQDIASMKWMLPVLTHGFIDYVDYSAPNYTIALNFALLFIEEAGELFESLIAVFGLEVVDSVFVWTREGSQGVMIAATIVSEISQILNEQRPEAIEKWANEATRWAIGCRNIKIAYRALVILNALHGSISSSFVSLLCEAVTFHLSRFSEDACEDVVMYISECLEVLFNHIDSSDIASFAFRFSSVFLRCRAFEQCITKAMPIFLNCVKHPVLGTAAKGVLVDAFESFCPMLETEKHAQELLLKITQIIDAPELLLVAATFLYEPLPFIDIGKTYEEILSAPISAQNATRTLQLFRSMLRNASRSLLDSIIHVSTEIMKKFEQSIDKQSLVPIYCIALQRLTFIPSAVQFMQELSRIDPSISNLKNEDPNNKSFEFIKKEISELTDPSGEVTPITNCKHLTQLHGIIDQKTPPKIYPFATQYEMFISLKKDANLNRAKNTSKKWSSQLVMTSGIISSTRSLILPTLIEGNNDFSNMDIEPIPLNPCHKSLLDLPNVETGKWQFIISPNQFIQLKQ